jgi:hypothetical protein
VVALPEAFGLPPVSDVIALSLLGIPIYLAVGMRRFYGGRWPATIGKAFFVGVSYNVLGGVTMIALFLLTVLG